MKNYLVKKVAMMLSWSIKDPKKRRVFRAKFIAKHTENRYRLYQKRYNMGYGSYAGKDFYVANPRHTVIGKYCSIANYVCLGLTQHPTETLTSHGFICHEYSPFFQGDLDIGEQDNVVHFPDEQLRKPITIGNDVWIGYRSIIMDGVKIGDGAIVAAGSVVTHDVAPYSIVGGVPAKEIKKRLSKKTGEGIPQWEKLLELSWWDYPFDFIKTLPFADVDKCIELLEKNIHLREDKKE